MCLIAIDERLKPNRREVRAWGVFDEDDCALCTAVFKEPVPTDVWHKAIGHEGRRCLRVEQTNIRYPFGFHKFATRRGTEMYRTRELWSGCVRPVLLRDVRVVGKQYAGSKNYKCYVAKEMLVPEVKR